MLVEYSGNSLGSASLSERLPARTIADRRQPMLLRIFADVCLRSRPGFVTVRYIAGGTPSVCEQLATCWAGRRRMRSPNFEASDRTVDWTPGW